MKNFKKLCLVSFLFSSAALAADAPPASGDLTLNVEVKGAILNVGTGLGGSKVNTKQAVASVLYGQLNGSVKASVDTQGLIANVGTGLDGSSVDACQSVASVGSDCVKTTLGD